MSRKRKRKAQAHVEKRVDQHRCLVPDCERSHDEPGSGRGICSRHYQSIQNRLRYMEASKALSHESKLISEGLLLERHEISKLRRPDPFASAG